MKTFKKDTDGILDYVWDWSDWLEEGESINGYEFTVPSDLTLEDHYELDGFITAWLSGGVEKKSYIVTCKMTTDSLPINRVDSRSAIYNLQER